MFRRIIKGWPNTYTFTKALAEKMLLQQGDGLPIVIVRPSIGKLLYTPRVIIKSLLCIMYTGHIHSWKCTYIKIL